MVVDLDTVGQNALIAANHLNNLVIRAHTRCSYNLRGQYVCRRESFFRRVGRWILAGVLIFFGLIFLLVLCCCIRRRRSKKVGA